MGFYEQHVLPRLIHLAMRAERLEPYRRRVVGAAEGRVLEIGMGSGLNLPFYPARVTQVLGLEPHSRLRAMVRGRAQMIAGSAEAIPLTDDSIDTVVTTWTLCSIPDVRAALTEIRRVLKPSGQLLFVEHGLAPDVAVQRSQQRWTPLWSKLAGGCHLDRAIPDLIRSAGFHVTDLRTGYMQGPRVMTYMYEGAAKRA